LIGPSLKVLNPCRKPVIFASAGMLMEDLRPDDVFVLDLATGCAFAAGQ
jgi:hypothetical protein